MRLIAIFFVLVIAGCGYHTPGAADTWVGGEARTLYVQLFDNQTVEPYLENYLTDALIAELALSRLLELTGLETEELQAKRLLASFDRYRSRVEEPRPPVNQSALKWLNEVFRPTLAHVPQELVGRVEPAQMFHEILEHRWNLSEKAGGDVGLDNATKSYISEILPFRSDSGRISL